MSYAYILHEFHKWYPWRTSIILRPKLLRNDAFCNTVIVNNFILFQQIRTGFFGEINRNNISIKNIISSIKIISCSRCQLRNKVPYKGEIQRIFAVVLSVRKIRVSIESIFKLTDTMKPRLGLEHSFYLEEMHAVICAQQYTKGARNYIAKVRSNGEADIHMKENLWMWELNQQKSHWNNLLN